MNESKEVKALKESITHLYRALEWQLEKEATSKKEPVWDDITEKIEWESAPTPAGYSILYGYLDGREILVSGGETQGGQIRVSEKYDGRIQIKSSSDAHQILLRMDKGGVYFAGITRRLLLRLLYSSPLS